MHTDFLSRSLASLRSTVRLRFARSRLAKAAFP
jgi:hypothetical protein